MAFMTKGFLMTSDDPQKEEEARLYTLSTFNLAKKHLQLPLIFYDEKKQMWVSRKFNGADIYLTEDEVVRLIGCAICGKIKMNNWKRYCDSNCPYYFNTPALRELI